MRDKILLIKPDEATGEVRQVFEDIRNSKGDRYLTPTWGFFAQVPEVLVGLWTAAKRLQVSEGVVPKPIMHGISLVCAVAVGCPRCINHHKVHLMDHFGFSEERADAVADFENSPHLGEDERAVFAFARKVAIAEKVKNSEFERVRALGYGDAGMVEIVTHALLESSFARHAFTVAQFEDGQNWPKENLPSETYGRVVHS